MAEVIITKDNFEDEVLNSEKTVLIDFWAPWCGPCRMMAPVVSEIADELPSVKVCKVNIDEEDELASKFGIMSIPTFLIIKNGEVTDQIIGAVPKASIVSKLGAE